MAEHTPRPFPGLAPVSRLPELGPVLGISPGPVCRVFGMRRSGNHAIINWLQRNAPGGNAVFFNNCTVGQSPFDAFSMAEVNGRRRPGDAATVAKRAGDGAAVIVSYEDVMPNEKRKRAVSGGLDEAVIDHEIVICRSFLNWSASLVKKIRPNPGYTPARRMMIVMRAVEVYGKMLELVLEAGARGITVIHYDQWHASPEYREGVLESLDFPCRDNGLGEVQRYGNGSSFQAEAESAEELRPEARGDQMREDAEYTIALWVAAQDEGLMGKIAKLFPEDARRLQEIAATRPFRLPEVQA